MQPKPLLKFPVLEINQKEYYDRIDAFLQDKSCIIYLDTNILATMFALYKGARDEFTAWVKEAKDDKRLFVPAWCIQEYSNRAVRNQLQEFSSNYSSSLKTTLKILPQLIDQLSLSINDTAAVQKGYQNREDYLARLFIVQDELLKLLQNVNPSKANHDSPAAVHQEVSDLFEKVVLPSNIYDLMQGCYEDYQTRYANKVPPGFEDEKQKERNQIGDFIIWLELIQAVERSKNATGDPAIKKIIFISNDQKIDWVYRPARIINAQNKPVSNLEDDSVYLIDPRLEYEMNLAAGCETEVLIISFARLVGALTRQRPSSFTLLASAVQFLNATEPPRAAPTASTTSDAGAASSTENASATESTGAAAGADTTEDANTAEDDNTADTGQPNSPKQETTTPEDSTTSLSLPYSSTALSDSRYSIPNTVTGYIIADLKSYTWDTQNRAINNISKINPTLLNGTPPDDLFVLGRNILQTANGGSFAARQFIERFPANLPSATPATIIHVFNGMMYEVYFNSEAQFRGSVGKTAYLNALYR